MRSVLFILFIAFNSVIFAKNWYVKSAGDDLNTGESDAQAWKTLNKVKDNSWRFAPGDSILFKRGDTFPGTLSIGISGTVDKPIIIGAYGEGEDPVINGFTELTVWNDYGNGIYYTPVTCEEELNPAYPDYVYLVTFDGENTAMGRYPDADWLTYESFVHSANLSSITDEQLTGTPNWTGAEVVMRKIRWMVDRNPITDHTDNTLTYKTGSQWSPTENFGYFIQNDIRTLDVVGEWYYDGDTLFMFFGSVDPTTKTVQMATTNIAIQVYYKNYHIYENLTLSGARIYGFWNRGGQYIGIQNCTIQFIGMNGIYNDQNTSDGSMAIDNNIITECNGIGIEIRGAGSYAWIKNNQVSNIGLLKGGCSLIESENWGDGIAFFHNNCIAEYNAVTNVGHSGIRFHNGNDIIVRNNYVNTFALTRYDAGGIYSWNQRPTEPTGQKIQNNIVLNGYSESSGIGGSNKLSVWGIYLDEHSINIDVSGNTAANCPEAGFIIYRSANITVRNNTFYNNGYQIQFSYMYGAELPIRNCVIEDNIFFAKETTQELLHYQSATDEINQFGTANNNCYTRPLDESVTFWISQPSTGAVFMTLAEWQSFTNQDANSYSFSFLSTSDDFRFEYNDTKQNKVINLDKRMVDVRLKEYVDSITLKPYESVILMVHPWPLGIDPNPYTPVPLIQLFPNPSFNILNILITEELDDEPIKITITDTSGKIVYQEKKRYYQNIIRIPLDLNPGTYIVHADLNGINSAAQTLIVVNK